MMDGRSPRGAAREGATPPERFDAPAFDYERSVARLGGSAALFDEIVVLFLEDAPQLLERARAALKQRNLAELERAAHSLKGLSVNFEARQMASAAYSVEQQAHDHDLERASEYFPEMERQLARLQGDLQQFRHRAQGSG